MTEREKKLEAALLPFAKLANTDTVKKAAENGGFLTLNNGTKMCVIEAEAFINALMVLQETK